MIQYKIEQYGTVGSTNDIAVSRALAGEREGLAVIAAEQTAGRGRRGRSFFSPGTGLYMSVVLRPDMAMTEATLITAAAAVAVAGAVEKASGRKTGIKWVNDILINSRKVCGILTESGSSGGKLDYAVLGIGINLTAPAGGFPEEIRDIAGAVFDEPGYPREQLASEILGRFFTFYSDLSRRAYMDEYIGRSTVIGERIYLMLPDGPEEATAVGIDRDAALTVRFSDGSLRRLQAGEVSIKKVPEKDKK